MKILELVISPSLSFKDLTLSAQLIYDSLDTDFDTDLCAQWKLRLRSHLLGLINVKEKLSCSGQQKFWFRKIYFSDKNRILL